MTGWSERAMPLEARRLVAGHRVGREEQRPVVGGLSVTLRPGRLVAILGPNGAGKTTLLRTLAGILAPLSGEVLLGGEALFDCTLERRAQHLAAVLTDRIQVGAMTVQELVGLGRLPYLGWGTKMTAADLEVVEAALATVEAHRLGPRRVSTLSDGERQRVLIARALAQETPILLADEPTAFLDPPNQEWIGQLLRELADAGRAVCLATHQLDLALAIADELWLVPEAGAVRVGGPYDLGLEGAFEELFLGDEDPRHFEPGTGRLKRGCSGPVVICEVTGPARPWVERAIGAAGFQAHQKTSARSPPIATVRAIAAGESSKPGGWLVVTSGGEGTEAASLSEMTYLLAGLRNS